MALIPWFSSIAAAAVAIGGIAVVVPDEPLDELLPEPNVVVAPAAGGVVSGESLAISVSVADPRGTEWQDASLSLHYSPDPLDQSALEEWFALDATDPVPSGRRLDVRELDPLDDAASPATVTFEIPVDELDLDDDAWGPRAVWATLSNDGESIAVGRSTLIGGDGGPDGEVALTTVMSITVPPTTTGLLDADLLAEYTTGGGLLTRQLNSALGSGVAIGVDPMIVASIRVLGDSAPESARAWLERLRLAPNETFALAYADADVAAMSQAAGRLLGIESLDFALDDSIVDGVEEVSDEAADGTSPPPPPPATPTPDPDVPTFPTLEELIELDHDIQGLAWPAAGTLVESDLPTLAAEGFENVIVSSENVAGPRIGAHLEADDVGLVRANSTLSTLFHDAAFAATRADWADAVSRMNAVLAAIAIDNPDRSTTVVATLDRITPRSTFRVRESLEQLGGEWLELTSLSTVLRSEAAPTSVVDLPESEPRLAVVQALVDAHELEQSFATVAADPLSITAERRARLLGLLSNSWRAAESAWSDESNAFLAESDELLSSVQLVETSRITVLNDRETLPVWIGNSLDVPVTVYVNVRANSPQLAIRGRRFEVTVEPNSTARESIIPVQSVGNGEVEIELSLESRSGVSIGETSRVVVNVQAGWEAIGTIAFGIVVGALLIVGVYRTLRRRRLAAASDPEQQDTQGSDG